MNGLRRRSTALPATLALTSLLCAACSLVTHYPQEMAGTLEAFDQGGFQAAYQKVEKGYNGALLPYLEGGLILQCLADPEQSNRIFTRAEERIRAYQERALLSLSQGAAQLGSLLVNEKTLPYEGEPFERVLVNTFKAMNYLFLRQAEGARVEIRRSFAVQEENRNLHRREIERLQGEARRQGIAAEGLINQVNDYYRDGDRIASRALNPYEDPFAYYLSALVYELNGEYNDAFIDLRRAQSLRPGVSYLENDLLCMARLAGMTDTLREWQRTLNREPVLTDRTRQGTLVLFLQCGWAPRKTQIKINLPIPRVGIVSLAFPRYEQVPNPVQGALLYDEAGTLQARSAVLTDVDALAFRNLQDRLPILVLKQILRAAAKGAMAKTATDEGGLAGALLASAYNVITEQADLRSWLTLPQSMQVARVALPRGTHRLVLAIQDGAGRSLREDRFSLEMKPGETHFVFARTGTRGLSALQVYGP